MKDAPGDGPPRVSRAPLSHQLPPSESTPPDPPALEPAAEGGQNQRALEARPAPRRKGLTQAAGERPRERAARRGSAALSAPAEARPWRPEELERLEKLGPELDESALARELGRPISAVRRMARELFPPRPRVGPWSDDEVDQLKEYLGAEPTDVIARILGRTAAEVEARIEELDGVRISGRWSREDVRRFRRLYGTRTDEDLARIFQRTSESIRRMAQRFALAKDKAFLKRLEGPAATRMPRWTQDELTLLRELYPTTANLELAHRLDRSVKSVVSKAHHLGLRKDPERLRAMGRENVALRYRRG